MFHIVGMDLKTVRCKYKQARQRIVREFAGECNAKLHDAAKNGKPAPNKEVGLLLPKAYNWTVLFNPLASLDSSKMVQY